MIQIGKYTPAQNGREALIQREFYGGGFEPFGFESRFATATAQIKDLRRGTLGYIVKDELAYVENPDQVCYVPELSDTPYTHNDLLAICDNQEGLARACFDCCDWQTPEVWFDELFCGCGWVKCPACGRVYDSETLPHCPFCKGGHEG